MEIQAASAAKKPESGEPVTYLSAFRAGYFPVPLEYIPEGGFEGIPFYLRFGDIDRSGVDGENYVLYRDGDVAFTVRERERLLQNGVHFIFIQTADQERFHKEIDHHLQTIVSDPTMAVSKKSAIVYETSRKLISEVLVDPCFALSGPCVKSVSRAITSLVLDDSESFSHLFATLRHDSYTTTHMVNVGTYMIGLAHAMGCSDPHELARIGEAGLLHDIGKIYVPETILNKPGLLLDEEYDVIQLHPEMGQMHLRKYEGMDPITATVARQHHERLDGTGYPDGLVADQIRQASKICAVVDSFEAMTSLRPYKDSPRTVVEASSILKAESPEKYDKYVVDAWLTLMRSTTQDSAVPEPIEDADPDEPSERRKRDRHAMKCSASVHVLIPTEEGWKKQPAIQMIAHDISTSGVCVMSQVPIEPGRRVRVHLLVRGWNVRYVDAVTVRCRKLEDEWHEIGMKLISRSDESDTPTY